MFKSYITNIIRNFWWFDYFSFEVGLPPLTSPLPNAPAPIQFLSPLTVPSRLLPLAQVRRWRDSAWDSSSAPAWPGWLAPWLLLPACTVRSTWAIARCSGRGGRESKYVKALELGLLRLFVVSYKQYLWVVPKCFGRDKHKAMKSRSAKVSINCNIGKSPLTKLPPNSSGTNPHAPLRASIFRENEVIRFGSIKNSCSNLSTINLFTKSNSFRVQFLQLTFYRLFLLVFVLSVPFYQQATNTSLRCTTFHSSAAVPSSVILNPAGRSASLLFALLSISNHYISHLYLIMILLSNELHILFCHQTPPVSRKKLYPIMHNADIPRRKNC